jgi:predicted nucleic acid-binding Zn ribbon protein
MADVHVGPLPEGTKHCRVCAEPINQQAQKCIHCQGDQGGWRRRLGLSTTVLSMLVALISVLTALIPVLKDAFTPLNSNLYWSLQGLDDKSLSVLVANQGVRAGSVSQFGLKVVGPKDEKVMSVCCARREMYVPLRPAEGINHSAFMVPSGGGLILEFVPDSAKKESTYPDVDSFIRRGEICSLEAAFTDFLGQTSAKSIPLVCSTAEALFIGYRM